MTGMPAALRAAIADYCKDATADDIAKHRAAQTQVYRSGGSSESAVADRDDVAAYVTARMPATYAAVVAALQSVERRAPHFAPVTVLDFGCGPGTASWAAVQIWDSIRAITMVDQNRHMLSAATALASEAPDDALRQSLVVESIPEGRFDLVIAAYVMSEVAAGQAAAMTKRLWSACRGVAVFVEPGTPAGYRRILQCRDGLRSAGAVIAAPCPSNRDCPIEGDDWCHFSVRLPRSRDHMRAKQAGVPYEDEKFSYVAAASEGERLTESAPRVIGPVASGKAGLRFRICGETGISEKQIPRRDRDAYRLHLRKKWGDSL